MQHQFPVKEAAKKAKKEAFLKCCFELYLQQTRRDCLGSINSSNFLFCLFTHTAVLHRFKWLGLCQGFRYSYFTALIMIFFSAKLHFQCEMCLDFFVFFFLPSLALLHCVLILACYCRLFRRAGLSIFVTVTDTNLWAVQINSLFSCWSRLVYLLFILLWKEGGGIC